MSESAERRRPLVVAIDGPAASGKSSTAKWVAEELGFRHVDSGALYRAATAATLRREKDSTKWTDGIVLAVVRSIGLVPGETSFHAVIDRQPVDEELRSTEVTTKVSLVARMPSVRAWVNDMVRHAAEGSPVVVDGRDMGTAVFPQARVKIFLVADPWERAKRRLVQRLERQPTEEEIAEETDALVHRDAKDEAQTQRATDAVLIDTTYLNQKEQVERIVALAKRVIRLG